MDLDLYRDIQYLSIQTYRSFQNLLLLVETGDHLYDWLILCHKLQSLAFSWHRYIYALFLLFQFLLFHDFGQLFLGMHYSCLLPLDLIHLGSSIHFFLYDKAWKSSVNLCFFIFKWQFSYKALYHLCLFFICTPDLMVLLARNDSQHAAGTKFTCFHPIGQYAYELYRIFTLNSLGWNLFPSNAENS